MTDINQAELNKTFYEYLNDIDMREVHKNQPRLNYMPTNLNSGSSYLDTIQSAFDSWGEFVTQTICYHHKDSNMQVPLFSYMYAGFDTHRMMILNYKLINIGSKYTLELKEGGNENNLKINNDKESDDSTDVLKNSKRMKTLYVVVNIDKSELKKHSKEKSMTVYSKNIVYLIVLHRYQMTNEWEFVHVCVMTPPSKKSEDERNYDSTEFTNSKIDIIKSEYVKDIITLYDFWTDDKINSKMKGFPNHSSSTTSDEFKIRIYSDSHKLSSKSLNERRLYISQLILSLTDSIVYYMLYRKMLVRSYDKFLLNLDLNDTIQQKIEDSMMEYDKMEDDAESIEMKNTVDVNNNVYNEYIKNMRRVSTIKVDDSNLDNAYYAKIWKNAHSKDKSSSKKMNIPNVKILCGYVSMMQMHHDIELFLKNPEEYLPNEYATKIDLKKEMEKKIVLSTSEIPRALVYLLNIMEDLNKHQEHLSQVISEKVRSKLLWSENMGTNSIRQLRRIQRADAAGVDATINGDGSESSSPQGLLKKYRMAPIDSSIYIKNAMVSAAAGVMVAALFT